MSGIETVANIRSASGGIEAEFPALGRPAQGVFMILFGLLFSGIGLTLLISGLQWFIGSVFTLVGLTITAAGLYYIGKSLKVLVSPEGLRTRRFLFGYPLATTAIGAREIQSLQIVQAGSMKSGHRTRVYYDLVATSRGGNKLTVAERLQGRAEAEFLRESYLSYLDLQLPT